MAAIYVPKKEQVIILIDSLKGNTKAEKTVSDLTAIELNNDERNEYSFCESRSSI